MDKSGLRFGVVAAAIALVIAIPVLGSDGEDPALTAIDSREECYLHHPGTNPLLPRQLENARTIISVGKAHHISEQGQVTAISTALQESHLCNIDFGDLDSVGLFQQRPSAGWGDAKALTNTAAASRAFYGVSDHTPNPGLLDVSGWERMPTTKAAQAVQRSAHPAAYAQWEPLATQIVRDNQDAEPLR